MTGNVCNGNEAYVTSGFDFRFANNKWGRGAGEGEEEKRKNDGVIS